MAGGKKVKCIKTESKSEGNRKHLSKQTKEVIVKVIKFMQQEATDNKHIKEFKQVTKRAACATGLSMRMIQRLCREMKPKENGESLSKATEVKSKLVDFDKRLLRQFIMEVYLTEKKNPTFQHIHKKFVEEHGYTGSQACLTRALNDIGFYWKKINTGRLLMEKPEIQQLRSSYLKNLTEFRKGNRNIVYIDTAYVYITHTKCLRDHTYGDPYISTPTGRRITVVNAADKNGFVKNAYLRIPPNKYNDLSELSYDDYKQWLEEKLIPNLQPNSVLVMENTPYNNVPVEKHPSITSSKDEMRDWLAQRNIPFPDDMEKIELYSLIKNHKPQVKIYRIDRIVADFGHTVLRLPPHHPNLNPINSVYECLKQYVAERNVNFHLNTVEYLCDEFFSLFSMQDWKMHGEQAKSVEEYFIERVPALDIALNKIIAYLQFGKENDVKDNDSSSDSDSD